MHDKKISVIVPVYNVEEYLKECVESLISQTWDNYEIILVDDGSTDSSGKICDFYAMSNENISVIHKKNGGLSSARNAGIPFATGKYIAFVDSDDKVHQDYLKIMIELMIKYDADLVACNYCEGQECVWEQDNNTIEIRSGNEILNKMNERDVLVTVAWNKLYDSKFFNQYGLRYPEGKIHEDMFLTPQILYHTKKMVITDKKLYFYRQRLNSIMNSKFSLKKLDILDAIRFRIHFFEKCRNNKLIKLEYESYIRKSIQLYFEMSAEKEAKYIRNKNNIYTEMYKIFKKKNVFLAISWKYKIKSFSFLVLEKLRGKDA